MPATPSPPRCWRMVSTSWAGRSSITGRAVCSPPASRSPMRWWPWCVTAPAARRTFGQPRWSSTRGWSPRARTAGRRCSSTQAPSTMSCRRCSRRASTTRRSCGPARPGTRSSSRSSGRPPGWASRLPSRIRIAMRSALPIATCWSSVRVPPGWLQPWPRRRVGRAWCSATNNRSSAARCSTSRKPASMASRRPNGLPPAWPPCGHAPT